MYRTALASLPFRTFSRSTFDRMSAGTVSRLFTNTSNEANYNGLRLEEKLTLQDLGLPDDMAGMLTKTLQLSVSDPCPELKQLDNGTDDCFD
jgi:hypothetical protein